MLLTYYIVKNLTFPKEEVWPFVLGSWDVIFVCRDASGEPGSNNVMWFRVGALGHVVSVDLETEFTPLGNQSVISDEDKMELIKTLNSEAGVSFLAWQCSVCIVVRPCILTPSGREQWELHVWHFSWTLSYVLLLLPDFNLYPFPVINHNFEHNSFH